MNNLERIVHFSPAFDGRPASKGGRQEWRTPGMKPDDGTAHTNYGVGSVVVTFVLKGPKGAVQFKICTDWYPPHVQRSEVGHKLQSLNGSSGIRPSGLDVGYHSPHPMYEGQEAMAAPGECRYVPEGCCCYYDGSSLRADDWVQEHLLRGGSEAVWAALEKEYCALSRSQRMTSPLPCQGGLDGNDACHLPNPCRSKREVDAGMRSVEWVIEHERCPELVARAEGWEVPR